MGQRSAPEHAAHRRRQAQPRRTRTSRGGRAPRSLRHLYEEFARFRQIFLDGRTHPIDPNPAWLGYSIGRWDGDTFVVDTHGFNDQTWLDDAGRPHSDAMRTIERFRRRDFGHMEMTLTIDDPKAYTRSWSVTIPFALMPDTELIESVCDNEKYSKRTDSVR